MQQAAVPGYRLSRSKKSTRVLTTLGLIGIMLGLMSAALLTLLKTGLSPSAVMTYYLGSDATGLNAMLGQNMRRPFLELAEITHLHLMGGSLLLFLLCHLLALCDVSEKLRITLYCIAFASFLLTFGLPWLIVYVHPVFSWGFGPSILTFMASIVLLASIPVVEMWFKDPR